MMEGVRTQADAVAATEAGRARARQEGWRATLGEEPVDQRVLATYDRGEGTVTLWWRSPMPEPVAPDQGRTP
jgi:hypothetical protein